MISWSGLTSWRTAGAGLPGDVFDIQNGIVGALRTSAPMMTCRFAYAHYDAVARILKG